MQAKHHKIPPAKNDATGIDIVSKYLAYWPLFLLFLFISVAGAFLYLRYTVPVYEASANIIIKDENKGAEDTKVMESLQTISTKKIIENEIEVLQSWTLMITVVKKLHLYAPIFQEGSLKSLSAYVLSPLTIEALNPDSLSTFEKIHLDYDKQHGMVTLDGSSKGPLTNG
jgi:uncharacterized protein involved in exopolysaccharide biosynthesis